MSERLKGISQQIHSATLTALECSTRLNLTCEDASEVFTRCLVSVALDAAKGDNKKASAWIDRVAIPDLLHFRKHLAKGGSTPPAVSGGQRFNS